LNYLRNCWYVFGWIHELDRAGGIVGQVLLELPVVVWRDESGELHAMEDRCPHRHAPLSLGRVEGKRLRCMYHGLAIDTQGVAVEMALMDQPPKCGVRTYPVRARDSWIWIWMGDPDKADETLIPEAFGLDNPDRPMASNSIEYDAHYQLVHDNLCDLSHVDFVHETTLKVATGVDWSASAPRVRTSARSIRMERWFENGMLPGDPATRVDVWSAYDFHAPGIFVMRGARYPAGTASRCGYQEPVDEAALVRNIEQQAVTPISFRRTAYHYATGLVGNTPELTRSLFQRMDVVMDTFQEDRDMIEAQQRIWDLTPPETARLFLPQDKAPHMFRQLMARLIAAEREPEKGLK
jgi:vanillate O-demethylase monooxygenase subunit